MIRKIELLVDDDDFNAIQKEFALRQVQDRGLPDSEEGASLAGRMVAEIIRDLKEYRELWRSEHA
jgi:hypothetical protein